MLVFRLQNKLCEFATSIQKTVFLITNTNQTHIWYGLINMHLRLEITTHITRVFFSLNKF